MSHITINKTTVVSGVKGPIPEIKEEIKRTLFPSEAKEALAFLNAYELRDTTLDEIITRRMLIGP